LRRGRQGERIVAEGRRKERTAKKSKAEKVTVRSEIPETRDCTSCVKSLKGGAWNGGGG